MQKNYCVTCFLSLITLVVKVAAFFIKPKAGEHKEFPAAGLLKCLAELSGYTSVGTNKPTQLKRKLRAFPMKLAATASPKTAKTTIR